MDTNSSANLLKGLTTWGINRFGHKAGRFIVDAMWQRPIVQHLVTAYPAEARALSEALVGATSMLELPGNHPFVRLINNISEVIATEMVEILEKEADDNPAVAAAMQKVDAAITSKLEEDVFIVLENIHKSMTCLTVAGYVQAATPPERKGKDDKVIQEPSRAVILKTTMQDALAARKPYCNLCYPVTLTETSAPAPEKPKKGSLFDHLKRFHEEEPLQCFRIMDQAFQPLTAEDHDLKAKFYKAFEQHDYATFLYVVKKPSKYWHAELDMLIGQPKRDPSMWKRERAQFERMFDALIEQMEEIPAWCHDVSAASRRGTEAFKAKCAARDATRTRKARATKYVVSFIVLVGVVAYFALINNPF